MNRFTKALMSVYIRKHFFLLVSLCLVGLASNSVAQFSQNFEDGPPNPLRTNDCYTSSSLSATTTDAIAINSARSSQLSNPANPATYGLPFLNIQAGAILTFNHKLNAFNGTRSLRVELLSAADNTATSTNNPTVLLNYTYVDATVQNVSLPLGVTGVYRIRFVFTGSGGSSRVVLDDIQVSNAVRSTIGTGTGATLSGCNALIPASIPPTAWDDSQFASLLLPTTILVLNNDSSGTSLINPARIDLDPNTSVEESTLVVPQGTFTVVGGVVTFTPSINFTSTFSITYTVKDNAGNTSNVAQITLTPLGPTAAEVDIFGRVVSVTGRPVARATVTITDLTSGTIRSTRTNQFGFFHFGSVELGSYVLDVRGRSSGAVSQFLTVSDQISDFDIVLPDNF